MRVWVLVTAASLGLAGASLAHPQDSPGTVYIDGSPCNLACQSYMAWSRKTLKESQATARAANKSTAKASGETLRKRISKRVEPISADAPSRKKTGNAQAALPAASEPPPLPRPRAEAVPLNVESRDAPAALTPALTPPPVPQSKAENVPLNVETSNPPRERTPQQLISAALAVAEQITNAEPPKATGGDRPNETKAEDASLSPPRDVGALVAILISRPDVKSASALKGLNIAIDAAQSVDEQDIRLALAAAGATETQLSFTDTSPLDRMISGDVQAAVVKLVSRDAAEAFPDIKGFKVLRVPLAR